MSSRPPLPIQPLNGRVPIIHADGTPTPAFVQYLQERGLDINGRVTPAQVALMIEEWSAGRFVNTNLPLIGGGALSADLTLDHAASGVVANTYGDASNVPVITVDVDGHITAASTVPVSGGGGGGGNWWFQPPAAASFTQATGGAHGWANFADDADAGLLFDAGTPFATDDTIYAYQAIPNPAADWTATMRFSVALPFINYSSFGIICQNSGNTRILTASMRGQGSGIPVLGMFRLLPASFNSETLVTIITPVNWLRMRRIGADIVNYVSADGKQWQEWTRTTIAAWLTTQPDRIGVGVLYNRATGINVIGAIEYWNFT